MGLLWQVFEQAQTVVPYEVLGEDASQKWRPVENAGEDNANKSASGLRVLSSGGTIVARSDRALWTSGVPCLPADFDRGLSRRL